MSRLRSLSSALLSFGLLAAGQPAMPVAGATPEPGAGQTQAPQPAATPQQNWGSCSQFIDDTTDIPTANAPRSRSRSTTPIPWGASQTRGDPHSGDGSADRIATGQSGRAGGIGGGDGRRDGRSWETPTSAAISIWSASTRAASATRRRRCAAAPTPNSTPTGANRWSTTAPPGWRTSSRSTGTWLRTA